MGDREVSGSGGPALRWQFWIDRGGTFTDVVARASDGRLRTHKLLSQNPDRYADAALAGIREVLGVGSEVPLPAEQIESVRMGTTVATNALLERKGEPTVLVITRGFRDALRIGTQSRPRIFDREIVQPELLHARVIEAHERIGAHGDVVEPLEEDTVRDALLDASRAGFCAVAIVLLHADRHPRHERRVAEIAREVGFPQVSASHEVSPMLKLVSRGDTTVADAYLSPVLRRYVDHVARELPGVRLLFMQSHGGLAAADRFQGKDAILSGPAGGIVGMARSSAAAGFERVIGIDMGGTSTDVSHYAGEYERDFETQVSGVRIRAPMLRIHTIAAGGGSILHFDGARLRVGPDSAGADPGPVCYRRGGPLTITDANVMLGRIQPAFFPHVFGPKGGEPLDREAVAERFRELAGEIAQATGRSRTPEQAAEDALAIAVAHMCEAIKRISVERGHDVRTYTLCVFGGAAGQHACAVADQLAMDRVFVHPLAGVLSAYGMGLADRRALRERTLQVALGSDTLAEIERTLDELADAASTELTGQGIDPARIVIERRVHIQYEGTDTALVVPAGPVDAMTAAFERAYERRFSFLSSERRLIAESASVEAICPGDAEPEVSAPCAPRSGPLTPSARVSAVFGGTARQAPLFERARLSAGDTIDGPAILAEASATTLVEPGWQAAVDARGHVVLRRSEPRPRQRALGTEADPAQLEIFNRLFMSIAEQMGQRLQNCAHSVNIKERLDFSCALFDGDARLIANAPHIPVHLGSMTPTVRAVLDDGTEPIVPGDVYVVNDPYQGGTHLPDVTVVTPIFDRTGSELLFCVASRGHHADIGGLTPGSMPPDSTRIEEEGVLISRFKLVEGAAPGRPGRLREAELRALLAGGDYPARNPDQNVADLRAQIAANEKGREELLQMVDRYGLDVVRAYMHHVRRNAEESVRRVIDVLHDGEFACVLDNGARIAVRISVDRDARSAAVDFTGSSPQLPNGFNAPSSIARAAVLYVFRTLVADEIPLNSGCLEPLRIVIPEGSMLAPRYPAAVVAGNVETSSCITNALYAALGVLASAPCTMNNLTFGNARYQYYETLAGGSGAGITDLAAGSQSVQGFHGADVVQTHMTNSRLTDPEVLELRFPVRIECHEIRADSGGAGRWRGGDGARRRICFLEPMTVALLANGHLRGPWGLAGGRDGAPGRAHVERADGRIESLGSTDRTEVQIGDRLVVETPGGGGFGTPRP